MLCLAFIIVAPGALWLRTHNKFATSMLEEVKDIDALGTSTGARVVVWHNYGIDLAASPSPRASESSTPMSDGADSSRGGFFAQASTQRAVDCRRLQAKVFSPSATSDDLISAFRARQGVWEKVASSSVSKSESENIAYLKGAWEALCL